MSVFRWCVATFTCMCADNNTPKVTCTTVN